MNRIFYSKISLEGVALVKSLLIGKTDKDHPCMVISQPWHVAANAQRPCPNCDEIKEFMVKMGFEERPKSYFGWFKKNEKILVVDAREDNFIKTPAGVTPIDLVISEELPIF
jgi:hypothetical protein